MDSSELITAYSQFRKRMDLPSNLPLPLLVYTDFDFKVHGASGAEWFVLQGMAEDFGRKLLNDLHEFGRQVLKLDSWDVVLAAYSTNERFELLMEFINPIAFYCLGFPYQIRNRLIFTAAHLLDLPAAFKMRSSEKRLPTDDAINFRVLEDLAANWERFPALATALEAVHATDFIKATANYRHSEAHRIPPNVELGYAQSMVRLPASPGELHIGLGGPPPLRLRQLTPELVAEYSRIRDAIVCWRELALEVAKFVRANLTGA